MANKIDFGSSVFNELLERLAEDERLLLTHMGLVAALLYYHHNDREKKGYFRGSRSKLMRISRIKSIATYHKCLSDLVSYGYVEYQPSWHPSLGSRFRLAPLS
ncbi:hypothetical protein SAMN02927921_02765 [Sinomicrobium oceani]|uniref:Helix-turn-helix domain-containing protein n=1 Tax=Sinomicrobium oceani TaxID=1150368 RepID=A0A1K1QQZ4_9FLAO|nr:hypothetical protein [Sinomicrobium oceani]SFW62351.1 hypothetical protein SAMN02927921_02765 [Sinomicrobium oceani]